MKISVIIPIYNMENYLQKCLDSVLASPVKDMEIIAVNDGSTDNSLQILNSYKDDRLKVFSKPNEGLYKTWKFGVEKANGEYIMFVDSDDYVNSTVFEDILKIINQYSPDLIQFGYDLVRQNSTTIRKFTPPANNEEVQFYEGDALKNLKLNLQICPRFGGEDFPASRWSKVFKSSLFKPFLSYTLPNGHFYEDVSVTIPFVHVVKNLCVTHKVYYHYDIARSGQITANFKDEHIEEFKTMFNFFKQKNNIFNFTDEELLNIRLKYYLGYVVRFIKQKQFKRAKQILKENDLIKDIKKCKFKSKIKKFLLQHKMVRCYYLLTKVKRFLNG